VIEYVNNKLLQALASTQAFVANRRGADSLEWLAVAVIIVGAFFVAFLLFRGQISSAGERIGDWLNT
jgi:hypothetical protein